MALLPSQVDSSKERMRLVLCGARMRAMDRGHIRKRTKASLTIIVWAFKIYKTSIGLETTLLSLLKMDRRTDLVQGMHPSKILMGSL